MDQLFGVTIMVDHFASVPWAGGIDPATKEKSVISLAGPNCSDPLKCAWSLNLSMFGLNFSSVKVPSGLLAASSLHNDEHVRVRRMPTNWPDRLPHEPSTPLCTFSTWTVKTLVVHQSSQCYNAWNSPVGILLGLVTKPSHVNREMYTVSSPRDRLRWSGLR